MWIRSALLVSSILIATGCPQQVAPAAKEVSAAPVVGAEDARVVADSSGDLYAATPTNPKESAKDTPGPGSGAPDETNGVCRLYAPKLPRPECCPRDFGLDVALVQRACGHALYLGESLHASCGFFFSGEDTTTTKPKWLRLSVALESTVAKAAAAHDERIGLRVAMDPSFRSTPVPGVEGAMWSRHEELRWALIPGWSQVRLLTWNAQSCSEEGIVEVIQHLAAAPEVPSDAPRSSLIPGASAAG
ncbi:MAG: hypothetical protein IPK80_33915 [Nannocystis sp.]|nr:hypothetical protein [Nannocystis sp.]